MTTAATTQSAFRSTAIAALVGAVVISLGNLAIASISLALGTPSVVQLTPGPYLMFSVLAGVVGAIGWAIIRRRAKEPRLVLGMLAAVGLALSLVPLVFLGIDMVKISGWTPVATLALMHVATFGLAYATFSTLLPVRRS